MSVRLNAVEFGACSCNAVGRTFCLAVCGSKRRCSACSAVWSSRPQLQVNDGASFVFLYMWTLSQLWPMRSLMTTTCCCWLKKWKSSHSVCCPRASLMRAFFSWKVTVVLLSSFRSKLMSLSTFSDPGRPQWAVTCCRNTHLWQIARRYLVFLCLGQRFLCSFCRCPTPPPRPLFCHRTATHRRHSAHLIPVSSGSVLTPLRPLLTPRLMSTKVSWFVSVCVRVCMCVYMYVCGCEMWVSQHMNAYMCVFNIG